MIANRASEDFAAISLSDDFRPIEHRCEIANCDDWGHFGFHELRDKRMIEHWFCQKHRPAKGVRL